MSEAEPEVVRGSSISPVWIIPIVAVVLGLWMVVHTWLSEGPEVEIYFRTAQGLEGGKTKVSYRNVQVGLVEEVLLSDDLERVVARVKLNKSVEGLLREDTRFWVVTARVGSGTVTGLETVISGAYIEMFPGEGARGARRFDALETPPLTPAGQDGIRLLLTSDKAASISTGDAVLYRGYKVGRVESAELNPRARAMRYTIFIDAPYNDLISSSSRFWDISGISIHAGADGIDVNVGSLATILMGGVEFGVPPGLPPGDPVADDSEFRLYPSREATLSNPYTHGLYYVVSFEQSIRGLVPGAPVEYRGVPIGRVERILVRESLASRATSVEYLEGSTGAALSVLLYLEPGRLELPDSQESVATLQRVVERGVSEGLRATLASGNLVTGSKFVTLDYYDDLAPQTLGEFVGFATIPTISTGLERAEQKLYALLDKFNQLPLETTVGNANQALADLGETLQSLKTVLDEESLQQLVAGLDATMAELRGTLGGFSPESEFYRNLNGSLADLEQVVDNLESVTATLADKPNALVMGASTAPDPVPRAKQ